MRYEVRVIGVGSEGRDSLGNMLYSTDDAAEAKQQADVLGTREYFGVAIVDRFASTVDFGGEYGVQPLSRVMIEG